MSERLTEHQPPQPELDTPDRDRALIVGAGFAGTVTAIRLLHNAVDPLEVVMFERVEEQRDGGLAYSRRTADWGHHLNLQAGRITAFREHPRDFIHWANNEADRSAWPESWQQVVFQASTAVPRPLYQQYPRDRRQQAEDTETPGVSVRLIQAEVIDMEIAEDGSVIATYLESSDGGAPVVKTMKAHKGILATGHVDSRIPDVAEPIRTSPRFVSNQYFPEGKAAIADLPKQETAFILGTGLSANDAAISLLENGHEGPIIMSSRHGFQNFTYPEGHVHEILRVRRPEFLNAEHLTRDDIVAGVIEELTYLKEQLQERRPDIPTIIHTERILKAWEPYVVELIQRLPAEDVQALLTMYQSLIVTSRIGMIPEIGNRIASGMEPRGEKLAQIQILTGTITNMAESGDKGRIRITVCEPDGRLTTKTAGLVIASTGQETDYANISHPLWRNLIHKRGLAIPHRKTGRGIEVGPYGELIDSQGEASRTLFAVGPMRQGDEMQRHGRLGAFAVGIGSVRNQCFGTAIGVLDSLRYVRPGTSRSALRQITGVEDAVASLVQEILPPGVVSPERTARVETIRYAAWLCLSATLLSMERGLLASMNPDEKKTMRGEIQQFETKLSAELEQRRSLPKAIIRRVIEEASRYRAALVVNDLTDITRLALEPENGCALPS